MPWYVTGVPSPGCVGVLLMLHYGHGIVNSMVRLIHSKHGNATRNTVTLYSQDIRDP